MLISALIAARSPHGALSPVREFVAGFGDGAVLTGAMSWPAWFTALAQRVDSGIMLVMPILGLVGILYRVIAARRAAEWERRRLDGR